MNDTVYHISRRTVSRRMRRFETSSLTNATLPYVIALANKGWKKACKDDPALALGLNVVEGKVVYKAVADVFDLKYEPIN